MSLVLDSSVSLAWCFEDEQTPSVMALLDRVTETGALAPLLWPLEFLNGLVVAERRGRIDAPKRKRLAEFVHHLPVSLDRETATHAWSDTIRLAEKFRLTTYDATYLEVALRRKLPLATLDKQLQSAARSSGAAVVGDDY